MLPHLPPLRWPSRYANYFPAIPGPFTDDQLRRLAAPTLVVGAERDVFGPGAGTLARAQAVFPRCETLLIPSSKHVPAQAKWDEAMQRILRFCREHGGLPAGGGAE